MVLSHVKRHPLVLSLLVLAWILGPLPAFAWGPAVHFHLAGRLLEMGLLAGALGRLLQRHDTAFLYGNVVADVVLGKDLVDDEEHSHNWTTAHDIRDVASTDRERAFALGVWSHLAADTVAHNNYVPHRQKDSLTTPRLSHVYWEIRAENWVPGEQRRSLKHLLKDDFTREEALLEDVIAESVFPFPVNWFVFKGLLRVAAHEQWHQLSQIPSRFTRRPLSPRIRESYLDVSLRRMAGSLEDSRTQQRILAMDPTGSD